MPDTLPSLRGQRILVTRAAEQATPFLGKLASLGAIPIAFPTIRIQPPQDWMALDRAFHHLASSEQAYDWLIFTSVNAVHICLQLVKELGLSVEIFRHARLAAIGPVTAAALEKAGVQAQLVPSEYVAEGVLAALRQETERQGEQLAGLRICLPRAAEARRILADELRESGALVEEIVAYTTLPVQPDDEEGQRVWQLLTEGSLDLITFTSSSTVRHFLRWLEQCARENAQPWQPLFQAQRPAIACIGPITATTARELGFVVAIEASEFTIEGLLQAILQARGSYL